MKLIVIAFCIFFVIIGFIIEKKKINALTIFSSLWGIIIFLSSIRLYDLNVVQDSTYTIFAIGILIFCIGYILFRVIFLKRNSTKDRNIENYSLRYKLMYALCIVIIILYIKDLIIVVKNIPRGESLAYIRLIAQDPTSVLYSSRSNIENAIRMIIVLPFIMALQPIVAIDMIKGKKNKILLALNIIILVLRTFTDGSRVLFIYFFMHIVLTFLLFNNVNYKEIIKKTKNKIIILLVCLIGVTAIYKTSVARSGENTLKNIYYYFSIEPYMFEQWKNEVDEKNVRGYGLASMNGFVFPTIYLVKNICRLDNYPEKWYNNIFLLINNTDKEWKVITSGSTKANAYVSLFWFLYLDGGILGVLIGCILYSAVIAYGYSKLELDTNNKNLAIYLLLLQGIVFSYVRMQFANETYTLSLLFVIFLIYKKDKCKEKT